MKRLTSRYKKFLLLRARREERKVRRRPADVVSARRNGARRQFLAMRAELPKPNLSYTCRPGYCTIIPPQNFDLVENYEDTLAFVMDMRRMFYERGVPSEDGKHRIPVFADFSVIREVTPAAGLVLAAEVDRWRLATGRQPWSFDREWHPNVQKCPPSAPMAQI